MTQDNEDYEQPSTPDESALVRQLRRTVMKVVEEGVGPITGSVAYAEARLSKTVRVTEGNGAPLRDAADDEQIERVIKRLIKESVAASTTNGFLTGLGGFVTMPLTIPANIAGALLINARLAGSIAYLRGYDLLDPHVQTFVTLASAGGTAASALQSVGVKVGSSLTAQAIKRIPMAVIRRINARVGFMLLAKYGTQRAAVTLAKGIPIAGGVVGGSVDAVLTAAVGVAARKSFPRDI